MEKRNRTLIRIEALMNSKNWSLYRLSKESGISYNTLRNLYLRNNEPTMETTRRLCKCFGISIAELFDEEMPVARTNDYSDTENNLILEFRSLSRKDKDLLLAYIAGLKKVVPPSGKGGKQDNRINK